MIKLNAHKLERKCTFNEEQTRLNYFTKGLSLKIIAKIIFIARVINRNAHYSHIFIHFLAIWPNLLVLKSCLN